MVGCSWIARSRRTPSVSALLVGVCLGLCVSAPARALTSANSEAVGVEANLTLLPLLGPGIPITLGPLPAGVSGSGTAPYSVSNSVLSASLSPPSTGQILSTGLLIGTASATVPAPEQADGSATVNNLLVDIVGNLVTPLIDLSATTVQSTAMATGTCAASMLSASGTTTLASASISVLGAAAVGISANPAPNTSLLPGVLGPLGIVITLNEQILSGDGVTFRGITVNAIHINLSGSVLAGIGLLSGDIVIAQSQAEVVCMNAAPTQTPTHTPTPSVTATASATGTATATRTTTATRTASATRTVTTTPTAGPPVIDPPLKPNDTRVPGSGPPNRNDGEMLICLIGGTNPIPNMPPCMAPDSIISMCGTDGAGRFIDGGFPGCIVPPLQIGQCVYAYDTITMLISNVVCVTAPAPAPALQPPMLLVALAILAVIAAIGLRRIRRSG